MVRRDIGIRRVQLCVGLVHSGSVGREGRLVLVDVRLIQGIGKSGLLGAYHPPLGGPLHGYHLAQEALRRMFACAGCKHVTWRDLRVSGEHHFRVGHGRHRSALIIRIQDHGFVTDHRCILVRQINGQLTISVTFATATSHSHDPKRVALCLRNGRFEAPIRPVRSINDLGGAKQIVITIDLHLFDSSRRFHFAFKNQFARLFKIDISPFLRRVPADVNRRIAL